MKKILNPILNFLLLLCLVACSSRTNITPLLSEAEEYMNEKPDSAYLLLMQVESPDLLPKDQNALWCLLYTQAMDKLALPHTSDSLIQVAVDYFENTSLMNRKTQAYYYCGRVFQDLGDALQAQSYYLKAEEAGNDLEDHSLLGRLYANLGTLYTYQDLYQLALGYEKKALFHFEQTSDSVSQSMVLKNIARIYVCENYPDSAVCYYSKALSCTSNAHSLYIMNELATAYNQLGNYKKALLYAKKAYTQLKTTNDTCQVNFTLGNVFKGLGQIDSAHLYFTHCLNSSNIYTLEGAYYALGQLEKAQNHLENYAFFQEQYEVLNDSVKLKNHKEILTKAQGLYDYQQVEKKKEQYRQVADRKALHLYQISLIGGGVLILLIVFIVYIYFIHRKKEDQLNQSLRVEEQKYRTSLQYLKDKEEAIIRLKEQYELEQHKKEEIVTELERKLDLEQQKKDEIVFLLHNQLELEQQKKIEIEEQLKSDLEIEIRSRIEAEKQLINQIEIEKRRKAEIEKRLELSLAMINESKNRKSLYESINMSQEETLFRDSDDYIGLYSDWTKMNKERWAILIDRIDHLLYKDFTHRLKFLYPNISEYELQICYLVKLNIPIKRIAFLLSTTSQTISVNRRRLYTKLTGKSGSSKDFDLFLSDF